MAPALFCVVLLFFLLAKRKSGGEICVSSLFCPVFVWFLICLEIVELRCFICLQFVYPLLSLLGPSLRAKSAATEGKKILCEVMQACRSGNPETLHSASIMTRSMQDLSEDEDSPLHQMSLIQVSNEMDAAERAFNIGSRITETVHAGSSSDHPSESRHVNAVANQFMNMLEDDSNENPEGKTNQTVMR